MKRIEKEWLSYECRVMPVNAGKNQRLETCRAFYAGALGVLSHIMKTLSNTGDDEPMPSDIEMMDEIEAELREFSADVKAGRK